VNNVSTYTVHPRTGSFLNMPVTRSFRFEILDKSTPKSVKVNGADAAYTYDSSKRKIIVDVINKKYNELPLTLVLTN